MLTTDTPKYNKLKDISIIEWINKVDIIYGRKVDKHIYSDTIIYTITDTIKNVTDAYEYISKELNNIITTPQCILVIKKKELWRYH